MFHDARYDLECLTPKWFLPLFFQVLRPEVVAHIWDAFFCSVAMHDGDGDAGVAVLIQADTYKSRLW